MSEMFYVQKLAVSSSVERELVIDGRLFCVLISAVPETWNPYIPYLLNLAVSSSVGRELLMANFPTY
ncbi:hypothetical protein T09_14929 [Trichinella sp. T9]|nr:hypothetical protein T09_14929 [Trichinella sp. T9]